MTDTDDNTLVAYADGELDAESAREVERLLRKDTVARERVARLRESAALLRAALNKPIHESVPPRLSQLLESKQPVSFHFERWAAAILIAVTSAVGGGYFARWSGQQNVPAVAAHAEDAGDQAVIADVASYHHLYAAKEEYLVESPPEDLTRIQSWSREHLHRRIRVPDLTKFGYRFRGSRLLVAAGRAVSQLVYLAPDRAPLAVCVTLGDAANSSPRTRFSQGLTLLSWKHDGYLYIVIGNEGEAVTSEIGRSVAAALS